MVKHALLVIAVTLAACGGGGDGVSDPGPNMGMDNLNSTSQLLRGPYLQAATPTSVVVSWSTDLSSGSAVSVTGPGLSKVFKGRTFAGDDVEGEHPLSDGYQHEVVVSGLQTGMRYTYSVTSLAAATAPASMAAAPAPGDSFDFLIYGDTRTEIARHQQVADAMAAKTPEYVLYTGDSVLIGNDNGEWNNFFSIEKKLLESAVYYPVFGNHEGIQGRGAWGTLFRLPGGLTERTYSFDLGSMHVAVIDAFDPNRAGVVAWLASDLAAAVQHGAKFKLVAVHTPLYTFSMHPPDKDLRAAVEPLLAQYGVQAVVTGHNHLYERFFVNGVSHLVVGGGGAPAYDEIAQSPLPDAMELRHAVASGLTFVMGHVSGPTLTLEARDTTDARRDCLVIDTTKPGQELACP